jgi:hypothetical protein
MDWLWDEGERNRSPGGRMELSLTAKEQTAAGAGLMGVIDQEFCVGDVDFEMLLDIWVAVPIRQVDI